MTALEDWVNHLPNTLTVEDYEALPEEVRRRIEIVDGTVVLSPSPLRPHQRIARYLANYLDNAGRPQFAVDTDIDVRLRDLPLLVRRPDIVVYDAALPEDAVLRPEHCLLVVEVMSVGSVKTDQVDKPVEYAMAGIEHFWRLERDADVTVLYRYRLDLAVRRYDQIGKDTGVVFIDEPLNLHLDLDNDLY